MERFGATFPLVTFPGNISLCCLRRCPWQQHHFQAILPQGHVFVTFHICNYLIFEKEREKKNIVGIDWYSLQEKQMVFRSM